MKLMQLATGLSNDVFGFWGRTRVPSWHNECFAGCLKIRTEVK